MLVAYNRGKMDEVRGTSLYEHYAAMSKCYDVVVGSIADDRMFYVIAVLWIGTKIIRTGSLHCRCTGCR